ncbi:YifB family Mg chelatase-like AAA ATPase [Nonomuraea rosea]|uniref:YifB family Mg chelatase-like AAA ATPase n=1 Tax=Nonomuraea rosea TaxID=638574 RepID=A0ABP7A489_9ACTN
MTFTATSSAIVIGLTGYVIRIEADLSPGLPGFHLVGLPDSTIAETRDRIRTAIVNSGWDWPQERITVTVLPADVPKYTSGLDLAIAVAILAADGKISPERVADTAFLGELGLDGTVRHVRGLSCAIASVVASGVRGVAIPAVDADQSTRCVTIPAASLADLVAHLNRDAPITGTTPRDEEASPPDLADLRGNHDARLAVEVSAAGGHHLLLVGDGPATMLAERLPGILPALDEATAAQVEKIYALTVTQRRSRRPPLCTPHYTNTVAAIFGCRVSGLVRPGAVSLAHAGVLFLDQAPEYPRSVLDGLCRPLETGEIIIADWDGIICLPASFQLLLATPPCPCATGTCRCRPVERRRYLNRLSSLGTRIDISAPIEPITWDAQPGESSRTVADRVAEARSRATHRLGGSPWKTNAQIPATELRTSYRLNPEALKPLEDQLCSGALTPRALARILRVTWTLADLRATDRPTGDDVREALRLWKGTPA